MIESEIGDELQVASSGEKKKPIYGHLISALQNTPDKLEWETVTARLIQEYEDHTLRSDQEGRKQVDGHAALIRRPSTQRYNRQRNTYATRKGSRRFFKCNKVGNYARNCPRRGGKFNRKFRENNHHDEGDDQFDRTHPAQLLVKTGNSSYLEFRKPTGNRTILNNGFENFLLDSIASDHMRCHRDLLHELHPIKTRGILLGDGQKCFPLHQGNIILRAFIRSENDDRITNMVLHDVLCVPNLIFNLISCDKLCDNGYLNEYIGKTTHGRLKRVSSFTRTFAARCRPDPSPVLVIMLLLLKNSLVMFPSTPSLGRKKLWICSSCITFGWRGGSIARLRG